MTLSALCFGDRKQYELPLCSLLQKAELFTKSSHCYSSTRSMSNQNRIKYYRGIFKYILNPRIGYGFQKANNITVILFIVCCLGNCMLSDFCIWGCALFQHSSHQEQFKAVFSVSYYIAITFLWFESLNPITIFDKTHTCWIKVCSHMFKLSV